MPIHPLLLGRAWRRIVVYPGAFDTGTKAFSRRIVEGQEDPFAQGQLLDQ
jgi:hypothetical protein